MINSKKLAQMLGISVQAVNLARQEGRITGVKQGREFFYDPDQAVADYSNRTLQPKAQAILEGVPSSGGSSVLDKDPKLWTTHEAQNAKAIFDAQLKKLELDKEQKKYIPTDEVEREVLRIVTDFSRALVGLPAKLKQKIDKLDDRDIQTIRELCKDIIETCESKL